MFNVRYFVGLIFYLAAPDKIPLAYEDRKSRHRHGGLRLANNNFRDFFYFFIRTANSAGVPLAGKYGIAAF
ncbi:MAG: hypothetical protein A3I66_09325 [Burkholderiales bacterium RIFCSPLOWO2_02_FULL_57_36]|nr:MAG: hypothetical protein A3I66_09325 [Burkholderiales bacterium RIFCSPLOWO2_02_FULL_57_36]